MKTLVLIETLFTQPTESQDFFHLIYKCTGNNYLFCDNKFVLLITVSCYVACIKFRCPLCKKCWLATKQNKFDNSGAWHDKIL